MICIHNLNTSNVGDLASSPALYFTFDEPILQWDILQPCPIGKEDAVIVGGGGLWKCDDFTGVLPRLAAVPCRLRITWGAGYHDSGQRIVPDRLIHRFHIVGVRDWMPGGALPWCPCVSCMHPGFDQDYVAEYPVVVFEQGSRIHKELSLPYPTRFNTEGTIADVLPFLASGETVVTNSYHGAYWATLLGRKVIVVAPFANKFYHFKHQPVVQDVTQLDFAAAVAYPGALAECRAANRAFYEQVQEALARTRA